MKRSVRRETRLLWPGSLRFGNRQKHDRSPDMHYLVGGLRISLEKETMTPAPRAHVLGFLSGITKLPWSYAVYVASEQPGLSRFATVPEGASQMAARKPPVWLLDMVRATAAIWAGICLAAKTRGAEPKIIYERAAVFQSLSSFHRGKRTAIRVVESNGILSRESTYDRASVGSEGLARWIEKRVYRRADFVVCVSAALADELATFADVSRSRIIVLPNAVPGVKFSEVPLERDLVSRVKVGFLGSVVQWQQIDLLITAAAEVNQMLPVGVPKLSVEIIGDGPEVQPLRRLAESLSTAVDVQFRGRVEHSVALKFAQRWNYGYCGHKATSSNSMYHSPLKIYEYAALGIPAISTYSEDAERLRLDGMPISYFSSPEELHRSLRGAVSAATSCAQNDSWRSNVVAKHSWEARARYLADQIKSISNDSF